MEMKNIINNVYFKTGVGIATAIVLIYNIVHLHESIKLKRLIYSKYGHLDVHKVNKNPPSMDDIE